jgi:hypothetical protein
MLIIWSRVGYKHREFCVEDIPAGTSDLELAEFVAAPEIPTEFQVTRYAKRNSALVQIFRE